MALDNPNLPSPSPPSNLSSHPLGSTSPSNLSHSNLPPTLLTDTSELLQNSSTSPKPSASEVSAGRNSPVEVYSKNSLTSPFPETAAREVPAFPFLKLRFQVGQIVEAFFNCFDWQTARPTISSTEVTNQPLFGKTQGWHRARILEIFDDSEEFMVEFLGEGIFCPKIQQDKALEGSDRTVWKKLPLRITKKEIRLNPEDCSYFQKRLGENEESSANGDRGKFNGDREKHPNERVFVQSRKPARWTTINCPTSAFFLVHSKKSDNDQSESNVLDLEPFRLVYQSEFPNNVPQYHDPLAAAEASPPIKNIHGVQLRRIRRRDYLDETKLQEILMLLSPSEFEVLHAKPMLSCIFVRWWDWWTQLHKNTDYKITSETPIRSMVEDRGIMEACNMLHYEIYTLWVRESIDMVQFQEVQYLLIFLRTSESTVFIFNFKPLIPKVNCAISTLNCALFSISASPKCAASTSAASTFSGLLKRE